MGSISHAGTDAALEQADPFSREEIEGIDKVDPARIPDARMSMPLTAGRSWGYLK